jgi:tetratricopeptide (TPR) repeat protein
MLVLFPVRAQIYERAALKASAESPERAQAYGRAARYAPWDSRYPDFLGSSLLIQSEQAPSAARRRDLLRRAATAERSAIATEPENGYYYATLGRIAASQALLQPPDASAGDVRAAFSEAMARDSVNAPIMDQATYALLRVGLADDARAIALRSARIYPDLARPMAYLGYAAMVDQRFGDAADTLRLAVDRKWWAEVSARAATWSNLSAAYLALGRNEEALRAAEEGLNVDPSSRDAEANRRLALERLGGDGPKPSGGSTR